MRKAALALPILLLAGCHGPADDFSKVDLPDPTPAASWVQFRNGPSGYAFQAPKTWTLDGGMGAGLLARAGMDASPLIRVLDPDAVRSRDLVSFALMRFILPSERRGELRVTDLNDLADKAQKGMAANLTDVRHERLKLDTGPAEHVWGTLALTGTDGVRRTMTSHILVFTTALHTYVAMYGYPADGEARYRPTLNGIVRTIRLFVPEKEGVVTIPESARPPASTTFTQSAPPPPRTFTAPPAWNSAPPSQQTPPPSTTNEPAPGPATGNGTSPTGTTGEAAPTPAQGGNPQNDPNPPASQPPVTGGNNPPGDPQGAPGTP